MQRPPRPRSESLTDGRTIRTIATTGTLTAGVSLAVYWVGLASAGEVAARTHVFAVLVFIELLRAFSARSATTPIWSMSFGDNLRLTVVVAASFLLQIAGHHVEPLRAFLQTASLPWSTCLALVLGALIPVLVLELAKTRDRA